MHHYVYELHNTETGTAAAMKGNKHLLGHKHSEETRARISETLRRAYKEGRKMRTGVAKRDHLGRIVSTSALACTSDA